VLRCLVLSALSPRTLKVDEVESGFNFMKKGAQWPKVLLNFSTHRKASASSLLVMAAMTFSCIIQILMAATATSRLKTAKPFLSILVKDARVMKLRTCELFDLNKI